MGQKTNPIGNRLGNYQRMGIKLGMVERTTVIKSLKMTK